MGAVDAPSLPPGLHEGEAPCNMSPGIFYHVPKPSKDGAGGTWLGGGSETQGTAFRLPTVIPSPFPIGQTASSQTKV